MLGRMFPRVALPAFGLLLLLGALALPARAQAPGSGRWSILDRLQAAPAAEGGGVAASAPAVPLEAPIDPDAYRLIPGDRLHLGVWGEFARELELVVSPEGDLIVPKAGPVRVSGLTLREAERRVLEVLRPVHGRAPASLRLLTPGTFRLSVTGLVAYPGHYEVTEAHRLSDVLEAAGGVRPGGSLRRVRLRALAEGGALGVAGLLGASGGSAPGLPGNGTGAPPVMEVDLLRWIVQGDDAANPFLLPGVTVEVPAQQEVVRVRGPLAGRGAALSRTGGYAPGTVEVEEEELTFQLEVRPGDTVGLLLDQLGGLNDRSTGAGVLRRDGRPPRALEVSSSEGRAVPLEPGDVLEIGYAPRWVFVTGSVRAPGRFPHLPGLDVREYVSMAGGPTENGRQTGWQLETQDGQRRKVERTEEVPSGATIRVPERATYRLTTWLAPLSTATALLISIVALTNN